MLSGSLTPARHTRSPVEVGVGEYKVGCFRGSASTVFISCIFNLIFTLPVTQTFPTETYDDLRAASDGMAAAVTAWDSWPRLPEVRRLGVVRLYRK